MRPTLGGGVGVGVKSVAFYSTLGGVGGCVLTRGAFGGSLCGYQSLHFVKMSRRSEMAWSWALQVMVGASLTAHVRTETACTRQLAAVGVG